MGWARVTETARVMTKVKALPWLVSPGFAR